jgi:hypothetical protein
MKTIGLAIGLVVFTIAAIVSIAEVIVRFKYGPDKKWLKSLLRLNPKLFFGLAFALALLTPSCATGPNSAGQNLALATSITESVVFIGATTYLQAKPQDRPAFVAADVALKGFIAAGTGDQAALVALLQSLPLQTFQGPKGKLVAGEAVILFDNLGQLILSLDKKGAVKGKVIPVAQAIELGLAMALGP